MENGWLIVCGVLSLVVLVNVGIALSFLRRGGRNQGGSLQRSMRFIRNPWEDENQALSELHARVAALEEDDDESTPTEPG